MSNLFTLSLSFLSRNTNQTKWNLSQVYGWWDLRCTGLGCRLMKPKIKTNKKEPIPNLDYKKPQGECVWYILWYYSIQQNHCSCVNRGEFSAWKGLDTGWIYIKQRNDQPHEHWNLKAKSKRRIIKEYQIQHYWTEWTEAEDTILEVFFRLPVKAFVQVSFCFKLWRPVLSPNFMRYRDRNEHRKVLLLLMNATPLWVAMRKLLIRMPVLQW